MDSPPACRHDARDNAASPPRPGRYGATTSSAVTTNLGDDSSETEATQQTPDDTPRPASSRTGSRDPRLLAAGAFFVFLIVAGCVAAATGLTSSHTMLQVASWFQTLGPRAALLFGVLYVVLALLAVPALPLALAAGYLFGAVAGTVVVSVASTLAALGAFLIARHALRDAVLDVAQRYPRFLAIDRAIAREGFKIVFLLRLSPLMPFSISNYLYGLTSVDWLPYVVASWIGMLPASAAYVSAGAAVSALTDIGSGKKPVVSPMLVVVSVVGSVGALALIGKLAAEAVAAAAEERESDGETESFPL